MSLREVVEDVSEKRIGQLSLSYRAHVVECKEDAKSRTLLYIRSFLIREDRGSMLEYIYIYIYRIGSFQYIEFAAIY